MQNMGVILLDADVNKIVVRCLSDPLITPVKPPECERESQNVFVRFPLLELTVDMRLK